MSTLRPFEKDLDQSSPNRNIAPLTTELDSEEKICVGGCRLSELAQKYDQIGNELRQKLKQRGGLTGFISGIMFGVILKALRFFFLDDVVEELQKKDTEKITSADIEHAVRRVGTEVIIAPITDNLFLLQVFNITVGLLLFSLPFSLLWLI